VTAEKEGFVITGPDVKGVFLAHKLAEIIVQVSDHADDSSLQVTQPIIINRKKGDIILYYFSGCAPFFVWWSKLPQEQHNWRRRNICI